MGQRPCVEASVSAYEFRGVRGLREARDVLWLFFRQTRQRPKAPADYAPVNGAVSSRPLIASLALAAGVHDLLVRHAAAHPTN